MTALNNNKETSINPMIIMDKAIDMSTRLSGSQFPVSIFPAKIQRIIKEVHECHSFPTDYISAAILTALAVGIGNTHLAQMKQGWLESPILYMALIGRPGANKSHPLSFAMKPFLDYDYEQNKLFEEQYSKFEEKMCMSRKERIENGEDGFPQEPVRKRFLVSDVTPEGLSYIHAQNKRGLCLWTDELSAWFKNFNRYNNGSEEQFWLSVFSAKTTISDRRSSKSSIFIKRPYISVIGTIQKKILSELAKGERSSNGFIDRILFVMPNLQQKARWSDRELPDNIERDWQTIIQHLIDMECPINEQQEIEPHVLSFTEEAKTRLYEWQHHFSEQCDNETNDTIVSIYCKLEIYIIRFCLIIQLARWTCGECDKEAIDLLSVEYHVGTSKHWTGATVFWQVDNQGKVRTGKVMLYNPETGKRVKEPYSHVSWVHSLIPHKDFNLCQCFFGEHLINKDKTKPIALVESEKTALIASYYLPQFLWIASGGKNGCFNTKSLSVLKNRDVVLFPDLGATTVWQDKLPMMQVLGIRATLFDFLEHQACEEDKAKGLDIADYLLKIKPAEAKLQALIKQNPAIRKLIDVFKLEIVDEPQPRFRTPKRQRGFRL